MFGAPLMPIIFTLLFGGAISGKGRQGAYVELRGAGDGGGGGGIGSGDGEGAGDGKKAGVWSGAGAGNAGTPRSGLRRRRMLTSRA